MSWTRAGLALVAVAAVALVLVSGGSDADPRTPPALPGEPAPFLGTAVAGGGGVTAAVDAYGDVVDLRRSPAGAALIDNPAARQAAGTVPAETGIVPRVSIDGGAELPLWRADSVSQRYLAGTNVVRTAARFGRVRVMVTVAVTAGTLAETVSVIAPPGVEATPSLGVHLTTGSEASCGRGGRARRVALVCDLAPMPTSLGAPADGEQRPNTGNEGSPGVADEPAPAALLIATTIARSAAARERAWLARAEPLNSTAPAWARRMYERSLLTLRALTDGESGAVAAGARDGWAYVWPRDAATAALALAGSGYRAEARRIAGFLLGLELGAGARFDGDGEPVPGRGPQGDAAGWVAAAAEATGLSATTRGTGGWPLPHAAAWRGRADYQEGQPGDYLANAIASGGPQAPFETSRGLIRRAGDPGSGLDSAAAWAVRPFPRPWLFPVVQRTLLSLAAEQTRFGITPGSGWQGGADPWTAPTAWTAWSLAALAAAQRSKPAAARHDRRQALRLLADLRRAATAAGALPERVDAETGVPRSTTPLAWSNAFAILALRQLWPTARAGASG